MFSLDGTYRYWLYNKPVDMRKSFNGLSGIVTNAMCERLFICRWLTGTKIFWGMDNE